MLQMAWLIVHQLNLEALLGKDLSNAAAHRAGTEDTYAFDRHILFPLARLFPEWAAARHVFQ
jgi:aminoglycoside/choline kinase family phosphotransferase